MLKCNAESFRLLTCNVVEWVLVSAASGRNLQNKNFNEAVVRLQHHWHTEMMAVKKFCSYCIQKINSLHWHKQKLAKEINSKVHGRKEGKGMALGKLLFVQGITKPGQLLYVGSSQTCITRSMSTKFLGCLLRPSSRACRVNSFRNLPLYINIVLGRCEVDGQTGEACKCGKEPGKPAYARTYSLNLHYSVTVCGSSLGASAGGEL